MQTADDQSPRARMQRYTQAFAAGDFEAALGQMRALISDYPTQMPLHWHLARVLKALGRVPEARAAIDRVIDLRGDHGPTLLLRAELRVLAGEDPESDLRRAIKDDPTLAAAHLLLARTLATSKPAESRTALTRALELDPDLAPAYVERADQSRRAAAVGFGDAASPDPDVLIAANGQRWSRTLLQSARADYEKALERKNDPRVRIKLGVVLSDLRDYAAALAAFDAVLALTPGDDPRHAAIATLRARSQGNDSSSEFERAHLLEQALAESVVAAVADVDTTAAPAPVAAPVLPAMSLAEALAAFGGPEPDDRIAADIAWRIRSLAVEVEPQWSRSQAEGYPRPMRDYAERVSKELSAHGFRVVGDYEPVHLAAQLSCPTLLRVYAASDGVSCGASYLIEPRRPGLLSYWFKRLTGKWQRPTVFELQTCFDDGGYLITSNAGANSPFAYRGTVDLQALSMHSSPAVIYARHRERIERFRREHPHATAERVDTEARILALQARIAAAKRNYRHSIGYVDADELRALLGPQHERLAARVRAKLAQMTAA